MEHADRYNWYRVESGPVMEAFELFFAARTYKTKKLVEFMNLVGAEDAFGDVFHWGIAGLKLKRCLDRIAMMPWKLRKNPKGPMMHEPDKRTIRGREYATFLKQFENIPEWRALCRTIDFHDCPMVIGGRSYIATFTWADLGGVLYLAIPIPEPDAEFPPEPWEPKEGLVAVPYYEYLKAKADDLAAKEEKKKAEAAEGGEG